MEQLPVLMIDNRSPVCCRFMQFLLNSGGIDMFYFMSLNSEQGREILRKYRIPRHVRSFMVLLDNDKIFLNSVAFWETTRKLNGKVPVFYWYLSLPDRRNGSGHSPAKKNFKED